MARNKGRRAWVKLHTSLLQSSINYELSLDEQMIFVKLILMAGQHNEDGHISDNDGKPMPLNYLAHLCYCSEDFFKHTIKKLINTNRIKENSKGIEITNWTAYQSEYARQKPYREAKKKRDYNNQKYSNLVKQ